MQVDKNAYDDFFGLNENVVEEINQPKEQGFDSLGNKDFDIFNPLEKSKEEVKTEEPKAVEEVDILEGDEKKEEENSLDYKPLISFFEDRIKKGMFSSLVDEEGNDVPLSKPEDIDAFLEANLEYKLEKERKELEQNWYQTKSPAWKAVAQYAEYIDDPSQLVPFLQGVQSVQNISEIDETTIDGAEQIIRYKMKLSGDDDETINEQVQLLKDSDKIVDIAKRYKPALVQNETQRLAEMQQRAAQEQQQYIQMVQQYEQSAIESIEKPLFGEKLSQDEKAVVYDLIAVPNEQLGGYAIFAAIDNLYEKNDLETLKEIALLIANKQNYYKYASRAASMKTANELQRKLRVQLESDKKSSGKDDPEVKNIKAPATKQQGKPRFGF
jgi:hypothetical protein